MDLCKINVYIYITYRGVVLFLWSALSCYFTHLENVKSSHK